MLEGFDSFPDDFLHFLADGFQIQSHFYRFSQDSFGLETDSTDLLQDSSDLNGIQTDSTELLEQIFKYFSDLNEILKDFNSFFFMKFF